MMIWPTIDGLWHLFRAVKAWGVFFLLSKWVRRGLKSQISNLENLEEGRAMKHGDMFHHWSPSRLLKGLVICLSIWDFSNKCFRWSVDHVFKIRMKENLVVMIIILKF